tara:strand:- start:514 stop:1260 length:747 start_codon:yes stop_codon:yes gene_type:complete
MAIRPKPKKQKVKKMEMTNDRERLLAKIKKLLNMAKHNASNETEAATALRQAEAMMRKHDIQFAEIEAKELNPSDMAMEGTGESRNSSWIWNLAWAASYLTSTMPTKRYSRESNAREIKFAGTKDDVQVALLMHDYLVGVTERLTKKYGGSRSENNAFKLGVAQTLVNRSHEIKEQREEEITKASESSTGRDLVIIKSDMIKAEFNLRYSSARRRRVSDWSAYSAGAKAGQSVSLNSQVGNTARARIR